MASARFATLAEKYKKKYITKDTLRGWVALNDRATGRGITAAEYEQITGEPYDIEGEETTGDEAEDGATGTDEAETGA